MIEHKYSVVTNLISWPSICATMAVGPWVGATVAIALGALIVRVVRG